MQGLNTLHNGTAAEGPIDLLFEIYERETAVSEVRSVETLVLLREFRGRLFWAECRHEIELTKWKRFLCQYQQVSRTIPFNERTVFCVGVYGQGALDAPVQEIWLAVHKWSGILSSIDTLLFASQLLRQRELGAFQFEIAARTIADLALWDLMVAEKLSLQKFGTILNPAEVLISFAEERDWNRTPNEPFDEAWSLGKADFLAGRKTIQAAALSGERLQKRILEAVWGAEVAVFFPMLERRRQELVEKLRPFLRVPFVTRFGERIDNVLDLEIGHIESQIRTRRGSLDPRILTEVSRLRKIRNRLSRQETVSTEILISAASLWAEDSNGRSS